MRRRLDEEVFGNASRGKQVSKRSQADVIRNHNHDGDSAETNPRGNEGSEESDKRLDKEPDSVGTTKHEVELTFLWERLETDGVTEAPEEPTASQETNNTDDNTSKEGYLSASICLSSTWNAIIRVNHGGRVRGDLHPDEESKVRDNIGGKNSKDNISISMMRVRSKGDLELTYR